MAPSVNLTNLSRKADKYHRLRRESREVRAELDNDIAAARAEGATYRDIAEAVKLSVAWVQNSVARTTPVAPASVEDAEAAGV